MSAKKRAVLTTLLELVGLALIVVAVFLSLGIAAALGIAGALIIGLSFLITRRGGRQ